MKTRLNFTDMQTFINGVVDGVITNGFGYKRFYTDYYTAVLYGEHDFGGTEDSPRDVSEVYEELTGIGLIEKIDNDQYVEILEAIDAEIEHRLNIMYRDTSMSNSDMALTALINVVSDYIEKFFEKMGDTDISEFMKIADVLKDNANPDAIVKAIIDNSSTQPNGKTRRAISKTK